MPAHGKTLPDTRRDLGPGRGVTSLSHLPDCILPAISPPRHIGHRSRRPAPRECGATRSARHRRPPRLHDWSASSCHEGSGRAPRAQQQVRTAAGGRKAASAGRPSRSAISRGDLSHRNLRVNVGRAILHHSLPGGFRFSSGSGSGAAPLVAQDFPDVRAEGWLASYEVTFAGLFPLASGAALGHALADAASQAESGRRRSRPAPACAGALRYAAPLLLRAGAGSGARAASVPAVALRRRRRRRDQRQREAQTQNCASSQPF